MCVLVFLALSAFSVHADTILAGTASRSDPGGDTFSVSGLGFSMDGASSFVASFGPCYIGIPTCTAPGTYSFDDTISSEQSPGLSGTYTVGGTTYSYLCNQGTTCGAVINFTGFLTLPDLGPTPPSNYVVTAPFTSTGGISGVMISPGVFAPSLSFVGGGTATITLREMAPSVYGFAAVSYNFVPTPEPSAIVFVGLGLAGLFLIRKHVREY
jgi:hypothetical protein